MWLSTELNPVLYALCSVITPDLVFRGHMWNQGSNQLSSLPSVLFLINFSYLRFRKWHAEKNLENKYRSQTNSIVLAEEVIPRTPYPIYY